MTRRIKIKPSHAFWIGFIGTLIFAIVFILFKVDEVKSIALILRPDIFFPEGFKLIVQLLYYSFTMGVVLSAIAWIANYSQKMEEKKNSETKNDK